MHSKYHEDRDLFMNNIKFIVSLASYSKRIETIHICLHSLFSQTLKPQKIILYLDESVDVNCLPNYAPEQLHHRQSRC